MSKGTILVVEPDVTVRKMLDIYFTGLGYHVSTCDNSQDALDMISTQVPVIILTEIDLPDRSEFEFLRELRQSPRTSHVPIVVVSNRGQREDKIRALELGADDYAVKPFHPEELKARVNQILHPKPSPIPNSLSGFPTGYMIEEHLNTRIREHKNNWIYLDVKISYFEPYREVYGWQAGEKVIKSIALIITDVLEQLGTPNDFAGHPGSDNFVVITETADWKNLAEMLAKRFSEMLPDFYRAEDIQRGFIVMKDEEKPLMSLSYGHFDISVHRPQDIREITELAAEDRRRKDPRYVESSDDGADILTAW